MPSWLSGDGQKEWDRVTAELAPLGILAVVDQSMLGDYCYCWQQLQSVRAVISEMGLLVPGDDDRMVKNPALQLEREYRAACLQYAQAFGFVPNARMKFDIRPSVNDTHADPHGLLD
jgi:P27 family predicted phage terminase small subunit